MSTTTQPSIGLKIEKTTREQFVLFCEAHDTNVSSAVNYLIRKTVELNTFPIQIEDILDYHQLTNDDKKAIYVKMASEDVKKRFQTLCLEYSISMTAALEIMMKKTVTYNKYPI